MNEFAHNIPILGIALVLAFAAGKFARHFRIPQVSAYLLVGLVMGPTIFNLMTKEMADSFHAINQVAFGLILFNIGGEFHRGIFEKVTRGQIKNSLYLAGLSFFFVSLICFGFSAFSDLNMAQRVVYSTFLGIVSIAAAPPTTLLVIKEFDAKGPLTQALIVYLAVGTVLALIVSHAFTSLYIEFGIWEGTQGHFIIQIFLLIWSLVGSLIVGLFLGLGLSFWEQKEHNESELLFAVICAILLGHTLAYYLKLEPLLISLFMGFALVNTSPVGVAIHARIKGQGLSIYALFFVIAGAHINLQEQFRTVGLLGLGYVLARSFGLIVGSRLAAKYTKEDKLIGDNLGFATLSHAGAALAIVTKITHESDPSAHAIITVVLSSIFIFEVLGPLILRFTLVRVGEVNIGGILGQQTSRASLTLFELVQNSLQNIGVLKQTEVPKLETIRLLVDPKVFAINGSASIKEVVQFVDTHHLPIYPVVDDEYNYKGIIQISKIKDVIFDPFKSKFSSAKSLIQSVQCLTEKSTFNEAQSAFNLYQTDILPVLKADSSKLIGTISYKNLLVAMNSSKED